MDAKAIAMLNELPRASLVALLGACRIPVSPTATDTTLRGIARSLHELGTLDAGEIANEWESLS